MNEAAPSTNGGEMIQADNTLNVDKVNNRYNIINYIIIVSSRDEVLTTWPH